MSKVAETRGGGGGVGSSFIQGNGSTSITSPSPSSSKSSASQVITSGKRSISGSPLLMSPQKKASPSDIIFGKPPGTDSASQAYSSLYADSSSSTNSSTSTHMTASINGGDGSGSLQSLPNSTQQVDDYSSASGSSSNASSSSDQQRLAASSEATTSNASARSQSVTEARTSIEHDIKVLPALFEDAEVDDIVELVSDMLTRLLTHNDQLPLHPTSLTRFHSRATPSISVLSYIKRITKYTSLEKACTLILLVYIDRVCERIPGFTICSLTVHRFICAAVVCASKALCDSFSTNGHYAKVGGISLIELNMLEKEFLNVIDWKLSCSGQLLQYYYTSLVSANPNPKYFQDLKGVEVDPPPPPMSLSLAKVLSKHSSQHHMPSDVEEGRDGDVDMDSSHT